MAASCSGFGMTSLRFCGRSFDISWTENLKTPSNAPSDSTISILILLCSGCQIMHEKQISDVILIDGLITNQNALLLPVRGWTEFGKMFGIEGKRFLSSPLLPNFFCSPQACSFARPLFARLFDLPAAWKRKGIGCYAGYTLLFATFIHIADTRKYLSLPPPLNFPSSHPRIWGVKTFNPSESTMFFYGDKCCRKLNIKQRLLLDLVSISYLLLWLISHTPPRACISFLVCHWGQRSLSKPSWVRSRCV